MIIETLSATDFHFCHRCGSIEYRDILMFAL